MKFVLIVTDAGPLITLAVADSLATLFLPGLPVIVPDMVRHEVIQDLSKPGAAAVADWIRANDPRRLTIGSTEVFEEFMLLKSINSATRSRDRGEQAAAEVMGRVLDEGDFGAVLLFEDSAVRKPHFLTRLPDRVVMASTSEFLVGLESRGLLHGAQSILDRAVDARGNEILARYLAESVSGEPAHESAPHLRP